MLPFKTNTMVARILLILLSYRLAGKWNFDLGIFIGSHLCFFLNLLIA